jgi:putative flavoprotein involved in K+ transport
LYFVGLPFQYSVTSDVLPGIGRDHAYIAKQISSRDRTTSPTTEIASSAAA